MPSGGVHPIALGKADSCGAPESRHPPPCGAQASGLAALSGTLQAEPLGNASASDRLSGFARPWRRARRASGPAPGPATRAGGHRHGLPRRPFARPQQQGRGPEKSFAFPSECSRRQGGRFRVAVPCPSSRSLSGRSCRPCFVAWAWTLPGSGRRASVADPLGRDAGGTNPGRRHARASPEELRALDCDESLRPGIAACNPGATFVYCAKHSRADWTSALNSKSPDRRPLVRATGLATVRAAVTASRRASIPVCAA